MQLSASGAVEVQQDLLVLTLGASADGKDAGNVQSQLRQVVDAATARMARSPAGRAAPSWCWKGATLAASPPRLHAFRP